MMNASNILSQAVPERIDVRFGSRPSTDARIEGSLVEHQHLMGGLSKPMAGKGGAGKELTAASALTSLVKPPPSGPSDDSQAEFDIPQRFTKSGRKKATPFPMKLMKVLCQPEYADIIAWLPDGKSFTIVRPKAFVADILPDHFKQAKYSSFTRKLHRWGFQRHLRGEEAGAFFHKLFQRGRLDLVEKMTCYKSDTDRAATPLVGNKSSFGVSFRDPIMARHGQQANRSLLLQQQHHQQQQLQQQLQQQNLMMQEQLRQPMHPASQRTGGAGGEGSVDRLNAAIELEVNRRLKERITAASISRQALALMQQQQLPGSGNDLTFGGSSGSSASMPLALNLLGKDENSTSLYNQNSFKNRSADRSFYGNSGGQDGLGLTQAQQQQLQLHQLQQQQAQLQQQQQQLQQQGMWGGQSFAFDNQGM